MTKLLTREEMIAAILATGSNDVEFLFNELNGLDLLMDAVNKSIEKMTSAELWRIYEKAKKSKRFKEE
jgi:hypothetical protein